MSEITALIGLGSNLGDRLGYLKDAVTLLARTEGIHVNAVSSVYETAPVGYTDQPNFLNCAVQLRTSLPPLDLLRVCMDIEQEAQRVRVIRWGPRTVDLDILFYGDTMLNLPELTVPHPRIPERGFVLVPLLELAPDYLHPALHKTVRELYADFEAQYGAPDDIKNIGPLP